MEHKNQEGKIWCQYSFKLKAIERSSAIKYYEKRREAWLRSTLGVFVKEECESPGALKDDIRGLKAQLEVIDKEKYQGALVRARAERFLLGEAPTKRAFSAEKSMPAEVR